MKKTLLMLVDFMATMTAFAQEEPEGWTKDFSPVAKQKDLKGVHTAVASDGAVYASSTYDHAFQFAGKDVKDPEGLLSSCVLKYDKDGNELWSVSLIGSCAIHAMTADTDGTLYIAGTATDDAKVVITGTDGASKEILIPYVFNILYEMDVKSCDPGFIAKISKDGVVEDVKDITTATNDEVAMDFENFYIPLDMISVRPYKLILEGNKLYVATRYMGDISSLNWKGAYVHEDGMTFDVYSYGVFSMSKSGFGDLASVAYVQQTGTITDSEYDVEALDFVVYKEVPHVAFFGFGKLTLTTTADSKNFSFTMEGESKNEHALVLANVKDLTKSIEFHAAPHSYLGASYNLVDATLVDDNCILGGHFYGNFPLDNKVTKEANTSFVASIKMTEGSAKWATPNEVESYATCMIVTGEEIKASTDVATYTLKTATGEVKTDMTMNQSFEDASVYNDQYVSTVSIEDETVDKDTQEITKPAKVVVFSPKMSPSGIEAIKAAAVNGEAKIYNLNGQRVAAPQKGLYIVNGKKAVIK